MTGFVGILRGMYARLASRAGRAPRGGDPQASTDQVRGELKRRTAHGALASMGGQMASLVLRTLSMAIMGRLLVEEEFGLVQMVTAVTGFLAYFRDAGLSMATVQRETVTEAQMSTLFWINCAIGLVLAVLCAVLGPVLASFYQEPRLVWVTAALGTAFLFSGASTQHRAMLMRDMRFGALAIIEIVALVISSVASVGAAFAGASYWSLVVMAVSLPMVTAVGIWFVSGWIPGLPRRDSGVRSMLHYGGTLTLNSVIVYLAYNTEKILLGKYFGAASLGIYGRAYTLINIPTENLNGAIGQVAFPALARVQNEPERLRNYFLKGYSLFLSLVLPITMACALFSHDIVRVLIGPRWDAAADVFRLLAPTIIAFALMNPFAWLMLATGRAQRSLKIALMIAPVVIIGYVAGLSHGPQGVAIGYSAAMLLLIPPMILWAKHGTLITTPDVLRAIMHPAISILLATAVVFLMGGLLARVGPVFLRLVAENCVLFGVYALVLLFVMKQKSVYLDLLRQTGLWRRGAAENAQ